MACFLFAGISMFWHAQSKTAGFDEPGHIQAGFYHLRHLDFERGLEHPPLLRLLAAAPLYFLNLQDPQTVYPQIFTPPISVQKENLYGEVLVFQNPKASAETILRLSRNMMIALSLVLLAFIGFWSYQWYGASGAMVSVFLSATFPAFLGNGAMVMLDVGGAAFAALALYALCALLEKPGQKQIILAGLVLGCAQICKHSNLILYFVFAVSVLFLPRQKNIARRILILAELVALSFFVINLGYAFQNSLPPHWLYPDEIAAYGWPRWLQTLYQWLPLPDYFLKSAAFTWHHARGGAPVYLLGAIHASGVWTYFPLQFLLRTPLISLGCFLLLAASLRGPARKGEWVLFLTLLVYAGFSFSAKLNLGIRHLLFIYPLLFLLCGRVGLNFKSWFTKKWLVGLAIVIQAIELARAAPHWLTFFNAAAGGPSAGWRYVLDSDCGQDLNLLADFLKAYPKAEVILSYSSTAPAEYYGVSYQALLPTWKLMVSPHVNSQNPQQEFLAVSLAHLYGSVNEREFFQWLAEARKPAAVLGRTIYVYEITRDFELHQKLAQIYLRNREPQKALRHELLSQRIR